MSPKIVLCNLRKPQGVTIRQQIRPAKQTEPELKIQPNLKPVRLYESDRAPVGLLESF